MVAARSESQPLSGLKVLLVEDNFLVALDLTLKLQKFGCEVVGPVASVDEGLKLAEDGTLSGAILDINLRDGDSSPIADRLRNRNCPFFFITGFTSPAMSIVDLRSVFRLHKPITDDDLQLAIREHLLT